MLDTKTVVKCIKAMRKHAPNIPVTVKCRIGVDDQDPSKSLPKFISALSDAGVLTFIIHARKAILTGLSPKENREIPPIDYKIVEQVKDQFSDLDICLNGEIKDLDSVSTFLKAGFSGCMIGREVYKNPRKILLDADQKIFGCVDKFPNIEQGIRIKRALESMLDYMDRNLNGVTRPSVILRHLVNSISGLPGAKNFRAVISRGISERQPGQVTLSKAMRLVDFG